jgi:regulatory protein PHO2
VQLVAEATADESVLPPHRRAKAKLFDGRQDLDITGLPLDLPPPLSAGYDAELNALVHETERESSLGKKVRPGVDNQSTAIVVIPCAELSVGTWRRVASTKYDLVAYVCDRQRTLTWFIHTGGQSFKMVVPFDTILDTKLTAMPPGMGQASFILSQPPSFYMEALDPGNTVVNKVWRRGADWTEGMQATKVLQHNLMGAAIQLGHVLRLIKASTVGPAVSLYHPTHPLDTASSPTIMPPSSGLVAIAGESQPSPSQPLPYGFNPQQPFLARRPSMMFSEPATSPSSLGSASYRSPSSASSAASSFPSPLYSTFPPAVANTSPSSQYPERPIRSSPDEMKHVAISQIASRRSLTDLHSHSHTGFTSQPQSLPPSSWYEDKRPSSSSSYQNPPPMDPGVTYYATT